MLRLFLPKTPGFKIMNVSIFDTFTDSPLCDHFWPFACVNRLKIVKLLSLHTNESSQGIMIALFKC